MIKKRKQSQGYAFILVIFSIVLIALVVTTVLTIIDISLDRRRFNATIAEMNNIKTAIIGNPSLISNQARTNFGYVGDMGNLPSSLDDLVNKGSQPDFIINAATGIGMGWSGPYVSQEFSEETDGYKKDAWGSPYDYTIKKGVLTFSSAGADRNFGSGSGYAQDIIITLNPGDYLADISGSIKDSSGGPITNSNWTDLILYYPAAGVQTSVSTTVDADGTFSFGDIPIGVRRAVITPNVGNLGKETTHLITVQLPISVMDIALCGNERGTFYYVQGSGATLGTGSEIVEIDVGNSDNVNNVVITAMRVFWQGGPNWGGNVPQLIRIYTDAKEYWKAKPKGAQNGDFIDLSKDIVISNNSILNNLKFEFGVPLKKKWKPIDMRRTSFNMEDYFSAGRSRAVSFATP